jgi:hypothetical protein
MKGAGLDLTVEGDISDFLGVKISRQPDGTIHLTQPHLIDQIIADLWLDRHDSVLSTKITPAADREPAPQAMHIVRGFRRALQVSLGHRKVELSGEDTPPRHEISCAVHQCARFSGTPKKENAKALKWLGRYLIATRDKGRADIMTKSVSVTLLQRHHMPIMGW